MIQIINNPNPKKRDLTNYEIICNCGCIFKCNEEDFERRLIGHGSGYDDVIICPNCNEVLWKNLLVHGVDGIIKRV